MTTPRSRPIEDRFWQFVSPEPNSGCWLWDGAVTTGSVSYGVIWLDRRNTYATHISLALHGKPRPSGHAYACHHCDVKWCVNPDHLYWGDRLSNAKDAADRDRWRRPELYCKAGHEQTPENTHKAGNRRRCGICRSLWLSARKRVR